MDDVYIRQDDSIPLNSNNHKLIRLSAFRSLVTL